MNKEKFEKNKQINKNLSDIQNKINQKQHNDFMNNYNKQKQEAINNWNKQINPQPVKPKFTDTLKRIEQAEQIKLNKQFDQSINDTNSNINDLENKIKDK